LDFTEIIHIFKTKKTDFLTLAATAIGTLAIGVEEGIMIGIGVSMYVKIVTYYYAYT